jgi:hypothetical protein
MTFIQIEQNKKALSAHDNKRYILENAIDTLAWGHYQIKVGKKPISQPS